MLAGQLDIFRDYEPRARKSDPVTSKEAGERAGKFCGKHHKDILGTLVSAGRPLTAEEIGEPVGLDNVQVCRRIGELVADKQVAVHDREGRNRNGYRATRYVVIP